MDGAMTNTQQKDMLDRVLDMINSRMDRIEGKIDDNTKTTDRVLVQAKRTNGRVTKLEKQMASSQARKVAKKLNLPPPPILYLVALGAVILLVIIAALLKVPLGGILG